ncbi:MAG: ATP-binding protein [Candidatus Poribacteria bacterium]|nr:ATP-binding protein [Candidatus Poribacteria bacterium]
MNLKSRYILIVNLVILTTMVVFFFVDDYRLRRTHIDAVIHGTAVGVEVKRLADQIQPEVQDTITATEFSTKENLNRLRQHLSDYDAQFRKAHVIDVRIIRSISDPEVIMSYSGTVERLFDHSGARTTLELSEPERRQLAAIIANYKSDQSGMVINMAPHRGVWATRLLIPYNWYANPSMTDPGTGGYTVAVGLIEILFDSSEISGYWKSFRLIHLLFIVLFIGSLTFLIEITTDRMVLRPLERLTGIIRRAEQGEVEADAAFPDNEVGRVSASLTNMLATMRRLHEERVGALERLASGVAHEIRNPLHAISMSAQYLRDLLENAAVPPAQKKDAAEVIEMVLDEVKELNRITNQFLNLTRPDKMHWEQGDLHGLLDKTAAELAILFKEANIQMVKRYESKPLLISMDVVRLRTAFYNLIRNAHDAMPQGGTFTITTRATPHNAVIEFADTGRGMTKQTMEQIFDPYFTTRENEGGMGLGLTLTQHAVFAHQGRIDVQSEENKGTLFRVTLPYRADRGGKADSSD